MKELVVHRAQPCGSHGPDNFTITSREPFPALADLDEGWRLHAYEGRAIAEILIDHLPGGTLDQLVAALLEHKASVLRVRSYRASDDVMCEPGRRPA